MASLVDSEASDPFTAQRPLGPMGKKDKEKKEEKEEGTKKREKDDTGDLPVDVERLDTVWRGARSTLCSVSYRRLFRSGG